jgi:predicted SnoaL-like aldol condensation-catalyzing enzyme
VFRFEGDQTVEHWDNIQARKGPNPAGHTMVDGPVEALDLEKTEANREVVRSFVEEVLIGSQHKKLGDYIDGERYTEHNPAMGDGLSALRSALRETTSAGDTRIRYTKLHRVLAEGNFVLSASEGFVSGVHSSFYDLFRVANGKLVEHWDTTEAIPPNSEWKNDNGKF